MGQYWEMVVRAVRAAIDEWAGDTEYQRYVRGCTERRETPLDRGRFFARRLEERYGRPARCC